MAEGNFETSETKKLFKTLAQNDILYQKILLSSVSRRSSKEPLHEEGVDIITLSLYLL